MSVDIFRASWDQGVSIVQYCFTSTEPIRLVRTESPGRPPRLSHSSWTMSQHSATEIYVPKLPALVYDILPSTTAVFSHAIGSRKLSANEQFFVGAQTVVSSLQTTQMISDVCVIIDHVAYASSNKTKIVGIETELFFSFFFFSFFLFSFLTPGWMRLMFTCVLGR